MRGVSPTNAASMSGINKSNVTLWKRKFEAGEDVRPGRDIVRKICAALSCEESWILEIDGEENQQDNSISMTPAKQKLLDSVDGMSDEQIIRLLAVVEAAKKMA